MGEVLKHFIDLGVGLVVGLVVVWIIAPTTAGGAVLLVVIAAALCKAIFALFRFLFGAKEAEKSGP